MQVNKVGLAPLIAKEENRSRAVFERLYNDALHRISRNEYLQRRMRRAKKGHGVFDVLRRAFAGSLHVPQEAPGQRPFERQMDGRQVDRAGAR